MPKLECPLRDFTSDSDYTPTAAQELADHLLKMHSKTPFPTDQNLIDADLVDGVLGETEGEARVKAGPAQAEVEAKRH